MDRIEIKKGHLLTELVKYSPFHFMKMKKITNLLIVRLSQCAESINTAPFACISSSAFRYHHLEYLHRDNRLQ